MKTLLEHILTKYLGKPRCSRGNGVSYWLCPICEHDSFHTMPSNPRFKDRAKCWNPECGFRGDAIDMLKEFHPDESYNERDDRLVFFRMEWEQRKKHLGSGRGVPRKGKK